MECNFKNLPFRNKSLPINERLDDLMSRLSLDEKIHLLTTHHHPIERLGIKEWYVGHEVARGYVGRDADRTSTVFPQPIGISSTFDPDLMLEIGKIAADECRAYFNADDKGGLMVWGPTVDMERDPRWGRNEEAYGEDPFLTGKMSAAYTLGLKGDDESCMKTIPTLKHFCANNNEEGRGHTSSNLDTRTRFEYYYSAFEPAITKGGAYSIMTAYNSICECPAVMNHDLNTILKKQWGLGFVVTDGGDFVQNVTYHDFCNSHAESLARCLEAGADCMTDIDSLVHNAAYKALNEGLISESDIDRAVRNVMEGRLRLGHFDDSTPFDNISTDIVNNDEFKKVNLTAALEGITLLKNDGLLPLSDSVKNILVAGPLSNVNLRDWYTGTWTYAVSPLEGIRKEFPNANILHDDGYDIITLRTCDGKYLSVSEDGTVSLSDNVSECEMFELHDWGENWINLFSVSNKKYLFVNDDRSVTAKTSEIYEWFTRETLNMFRYDDKVSFEDYQHHMQFTVEDGTLKVCTHRHADKHMLFEMEVVSKGADRISKLAEKADCVIICVGNDPQQVARECFDRKDILLPETQDSLIKSAFSSNKNTLEVIISSYPFAVNFEQQNLPAIIYTSHAGSELGNALALTLSGKNNPAGRTPQTWYKSINDLPDILDYDIKRNKVTYLYFDGTPLYPFGYGLSYSEFKYSDCSAVFDTENIIVNLTVENVSDIDGEEVVQVYVRPLNPCNDRPLKKLCGFKRVKIAAHKSLNVTVNIPKDELRFYDVRSESFKVEQGEYLFMTGASSSDIRCENTVFVSGEVFGERLLDKTTSACLYDECEGVIIKYSKKLNCNYIFTNKWVCSVTFKNVSFKGVNSIEITASSPTETKNISVSAGGKNIAECSIPASDAFDDFKTFSVPLTEIPDAPSDLSIDMGENISLLSVRLI